jgi:hypothetical protein
MKSAVSALIVALAISSSAIADSRIPLVQPKASPLKLASVTTKEQHEATFSGEIWVTGTLYAEWYGRSKPTVEYKLIPDTKSRKMLPHFARYGVTWVGITNGQAALQMAVPPATFQRVTDRQVKLFKVTGAWKIDSYTVGIECDAPYAYATVLAADIPDQSLVASINRPHTC